MGGLARQVSFVEHIRQNGDSIIVVDSGDCFFKTYTEPNHSGPVIDKAKVIVKAYNKKNMAAMNVGDMDLSYGIDFLKEARESGLPLISANLTDPDGVKTVFPPYLIKEQGGIRFAFFGLTYPELNAGIQNAVLGQVSLNDPIETTRKLLPELKEKADIVVLLSDLGLVRERELAKKVPGIDFILGGHDGRFLRYPHVQDDTFIVQSYKRGMYLGFLNLEIKEPGQPFQDLDAGVQTQKKLEALERRMAAINKALERRPDNPSLVRTKTMIEVNMKKERDKLNNNSEQSVNGNGFKWEVKRLPSDLPEDPEVLQWFKDANIEKD